ncbi:MAG: translation initiation factor IF-2 associated domain-containing protein, partial [Methylobacter sp.]
MNNKTVRQLAEVVKIPLERLLEQLKEAGLSASAPDDVINEDEKMQLLAHLRKRHGKDDVATEGTLKRVTLKRRTVSELKQASVPGSTTKTISVEVRKQKTYIKRSEVTESDEQRNLELAKQAVEEQIAKQTETLAPVEEVVKPEEVVLEQKKEEAAVEPEVQAVAELVEAEVVAEPEVEQAKSVEIEDISTSLAVEEGIEDLSVQEEKKIAHEKSVKVKESAEARKKQQEKDLRLEESIKRNAD